VVDLNPLMLTVRIWDCGDIDANGISRKLISFSRFALRVFADEDRRKPLAYSSVRPNRLADVFLHFVTLDAAAAYSISSSSTLGSPVPSPGQFDECHGPAPPCKPADIVRGAASVSPP